nr:RNA-directed DNA polymerase, eukaryota, reverse transcriptase zinc-binding domain protein [Tanacetum cinerariifolium]
EFQHFGRIVDAFIANKRSKQGKRFEFVRFLGIHNEEVFAKSLSNVWIESYHVFVSVAKFQRNPIKPHASTQQLSKASHDLPTFNTNNLPPKRSYASVIHAESRNNLSQQSKLDNIKSIQLNDDDLILVEDSSIVDLIKVKEIETISNMYHVCQAEGFMDVKIHYVGGLWVWLQFSSVNSCEAFKSNESLNLWTFIKIPSPSFVVDERVIWIEVSGLPLCAWGSSAFKKIANLFGKFNFFDDDVEDSMCMGRACITTKIQSLISEKVNVTIKDSNFNVYVKEIGKCSTSFGNYKRKELKGFSFIDEMSQMIEVGGTLGYDV